MGGRWEQRSLGTATHLPLRAGHNRMLTAEAGGMGSESSPCFLLLGETKYKFFVFYSISVGLTLETGK